MTNLKEKFLSATKKLLIGAGITAGTVFSNAPRANATNIPFEKKQKIELSTIGTDKVLNIDYSHIKIRNYSDVETLFNQAEILIFNTLLLTQGAWDEVYMRGGTNPDAIGTGSKYVPENPDMYNDYNAVWYSLSRPETKKFLPSKQEITYTDMQKYVIGWGKYRTQTKENGTNTIRRHKTILRQIYENIKGAELSPNELAAIYCLVFEDEAKLRSICNFIQDYYHNKIKCANAFMEQKFIDNKYYQPEKVAIFLALLYLNDDNFCNDMVNMGFDWHTHRTALYTAEIKPKELTEKNHIAYSNDCKTKMLNCFFPNQHTMSNLIPDQDLHIRNPNQELFAQAVKKYNDRDYVGALEQLQQLEKNKVTNPIVLNYLAATCFYTKQYENCIKYAATVLGGTDRTEYAKAAVFYGRAQLKLNHPDIALTYFKKALDYVFYSPGIESKTWEDAARFGKKDAEEMLQNMSTKKKSKNR